MVQTLDVGTHLLFIGEVVAGELISDAQPPLTYAYYREVKKGKAPKNAPTYIPPASTAAAPPAAAAPAGKYVCTFAMFMTRNRRPAAGIPAGTRLRTCPGVGLPGLRRPQMALSPKPDLTLDLLLRYKRLKLCEIPRGSEG